MQPREQRLGQPPGPVTRSAGSISGGNDGARKAPALPSLAITGWLRHYVENGITISVCIGLVGVLVTVPLGLPAGISAITGGLCASLVDLPLPLRQKPGLFLAIGILTTLVTLLTGAAAGKPWLLAGVIAFVSILFAVLSAFERPWITLGVSGVLALALGMALPPGNAGALLSHTELFALGAAAYALIALSIELLIGFVPGARPAAAAAEIGSDRLDPSRAIAPARLWFALRLTLAMLLGYGITLLLPGYVHGGWVLLTVGLIMRASSAVTRSRGNARVLGTVAGCAIATALVRFTPFPVLVAAVLLSAGLAHAYAPVNYALTSLGASVMALLLVYLLQPGPILIGDRILDTLIGAAISGLFSIIGCDKSPDDQTATAGGSAR